MCSSYSQKKKINEKAGMTEIKAAVHREPVQWCHRIRRLGYRRSKLHLTIQLFSVSLATGTRENKLSGGGEKTLCKCYLLQCPAHIGFGPGVPSFKLFSTYSIFCSVLNLSSPLNISWHCQSGDGYCSPPNEGPISWPPVCWIRHETLMNTIRHARVSNAASILRWKRLNTKMTRL